MPHINHIRNVHDYNVLVGQPDLHPLISVIDYAELPPISRLLFKFEVYGIFVYDINLENISYGRYKYDYQEGTLISVAPEQIGGAEDNGQTRAIGGYALLFDPKLLEGTVLKDQIKDFTFFSYHANEALHMTREERENIVLLVRRIKKELLTKTDIHQNSVIISYIELILKYCMRFYDRQFTTRKIQYSDIMDRFRNLLASYFATGKYLESGLPTVQYCAGELFMSPNYFSDLIRKNTGETASDYIRHFIVDTVKNKLIEGQRLKDIAYDLGFSYPPRLSRLFKKYTGETPSEYCNRIRNK